MIKPRRLSIGDTIATVSPALGCAGDDDIRWKYQLGVERLEDLGLRVVAAPNALRGEAFLSKHPQARAEDIQWAFENKQVNAIIANIGGNDAMRLLSYLNPQAIIENPKIFCGYSDIMVLHIYMYSLGLSTFYGDNLLTTIAEAEGWHEYSQYWFFKTLFSPEKIGTIHPSHDWSYSPNDHFHPAYQKVYHPNPGYKHIQGHGIAKGHLFGGHSGLVEQGMPLTAAMFDGAILFYEDIPQYFSADTFRQFLTALGEKGYLQRLNGILIGKLCFANDFDDFAETARHVIGDVFGLPTLPVMSGVNFGHASPICMIPYGAQAEMDVDNLQLRITESGVV